MPQINNEPFHFDFDEKDRSERLFGFSEKTKTYMIIRKKENEKKEGDNVLLRVTPASMK